MKFGNDILAGLRLIREAIQSLNFVTGTSGWRIDRDGDAEFNELEARGNIKASTVEVEDSVTGERVLIDPSSWQSGQPAVHLEPDEATHPGVVFGDWSPVQDTGSVRIHPPRNVDNRFVGLDVHSEGVQPAGISTITSGTLTQTPRFVIGSTWELVNSGETDLRGRIANDAGSGLDLDDDVNISGDVDIGGALTVSGTVHFANVCQRIDTDIVTSDSSTFNSETQVQSITASLVSGRTYRVTWDTAFDSSTSNNEIIGRIREDNSSGTELQGKHCDSRLNNRRWPLRIEAEYTAISTGSKTFSLTGTPASGSGRMRAASNFPSYAYVDYVRG